MFSVRFDSGTWATFYINDKKPTTTYSAMFLQADGDELELIRSQFDNLPITRGNICHWSSEMAEFVFSNMILC